MMYLSVFFGYFMVNSYKLFGLWSDTFKDNQSFLVFIGASGSFCSSIWFVFGFMMEKFSFRFTFTLLLVLEMIVTATMIFSVKTQATYFMSICLTLWLEGGHFTLFPTVCAKLFKNQGPTLYSLGFATFGLSCLTSILIVKVFLDKLVGYFGVFMICLGM